MSETGEVHPAASAAGRFTGTLPQLYEDYMVPLMFAVYADAMAQRVLARSPAAVLETAAGTGVVTRAVAPRLGPGARYVASDLNQSMLELAADRLGADPRVTWQQADALALPFPDASFDVVCCQFGAMFFPDRVAAYREAHRVLKAGGRLELSVWDGLEENVFARDVSDALAALFPHDPPQFFATIPHGYHDATLIRDELSTAGFTRVTIETRREQSRAPSPRHPAVALCQGTPMRGEIEARGDLQEATDHVGDWLAQRHGSGAVTATMQALVVTADR